MLIFVYIRSFIYFILSQVLKIKLFKIFLSIIISILNIAYNVEIHQNQKDALSTIKITVNVISSFFYLILLVDLFSKKCFRLFYLTINFFSFSLPSLNFIEPTSNLIFLKETLNSFKNNTNIYIQIIHILVLITLFLTNKLYLIKRTLVFNDYSIDR